MRIRRGGWESRGTARPANRRFAPPSQHHHIIPVILTNPSRHSHKPSQAFSQTPHVIPGLGGGRHNRLQTLRAFPQTLPGIPTNPPGILTNPPRHSHNPSRHSREGGNLAVCVRSAFRGTPAPRYTRLNHRGVAAPTNRGGLRRNPSCDTYQEARTMMRGTSGIGKRETPLWAGRRATARSC